MVEASGHVRGQEEPDEAAGDQHRGPAYAVGPRRVHGVIPQHVPVAGQQVAVPTHAQALAPDVAGATRLAVLLDLSQPADATSAARPGFWQSCGFTLVIDDPRFPVMRRELA